MLNRRTGAPNFLGFIHELNSCQGCEKRLWDQAHTPMPGGYRKPPENSRCPLLVEETLDSVQKTLRNHCSVLYTQKKKNLFILKNMRAYPSWMTWLMWGDPLRAQELWGPLSPQSILVFSFPFSLIGLVYCRFFSATVSFQSNLTFVLLNDAYYKGGRNKCLEVSDFLLFFFLKKN